MKLYRETYKIIASLFGTKSVAVSLFNLFIHDLLKGKKFFTPIYLKMTHYPQVPKDEFFTSFFYFAGEGIKLFDIKLHHVENDIEYSLPLSLLRSWLEDKTRTIINPQTGNMIPDFSQVYLRFFPTNKFNSMIQEMKDIDHLVNVLQKLREEINVDIPKEPYHIELLSTTSTKR